MNTLDNYSVNAVKTFIGREGYGYNCNLLFNGKKVAQIINHADGGVVRFYWLDNNDVTNVNTKNYKGEIESHNGTVEEAKFQEVVINLPGISVEGGSGELTTNADIVLDDLVNDFLVEKKVKSDMKKTFTIQEKDGKLLSWKMTPTQTIDVLKKFIKNKHPDAKIINDLSVKEVIEIYKKNGIIS